MQITMVITKLIKSNGGFYDPQVMEASVLNLAFIFKGCSVKTTAKMVKLKISLLSIKNIRCFGLLQYECAKYLSSMKFC